jgi:hypothetical protein
LNSPCYKTPEKRDNKNRAKQPTTEEGKKMEKKMPHLFVMSPDGFFRKKNFVSCFGTPLVTKRQKMRSKKSRENKNKIKSVTILFWRFRHLFFHGAPCPRGPSASSTGIIYSQTRRQPPVGVQVDDLLPSSRH